MAQDVVRIKMIRQLLYTTMATSTILPLPIASSPAAPAVALSPASAHPVAPSPMTGQFDPDACESVYTRLHSAGCAAAGCYTPCENLLQHMLKHYDQKSVVVKRAGVVVHDPSVRTGSRWTFSDPALIRDLETHILSDLTLDHGLTECPTMDHTHGDVLLYKEGDEFHWHRDEVPVRPDGVSPEARFYTFLLGLHDTVEGGHTQIIDDYSVCHGYKESASYGEYLVFPSTHSHSGAPITRGYKMALKMDLWLDPSTVTLASRTDGWNTHSPSEDYEDWWVDMMFENDERGEDDMCNGYELD